ncbi:MAG: DUF3052 domain-containing protein [Gemmatimonadota bacterium]
MSAGYSGTPLARKLGIREGHRVATLNAPDHFSGLLGELPDGVELAAAPRRDDEIGEEVRSRDVVVLFAPDRGALLGHLPAACRLLSWDGGLWVAWPKRSSPLAADLAREGVRRAGLDRGLVDNKVCAVDADWSALRFVHRLEDRP